MTTKLILLFSLLFFANEINAGGKNTDSTDEESSEFYEDWEDFEVEMDIFEGSPTISLNYGLSKMKLDGFGASFADPSVPEIKLGYTSQKASRYSQGILKYKYRYLFLNSFRNDISDSETENEIKSKMWRFGFGEASGYGYNLGSQAVIPYFTHTLNWSRFDFENFPGDTVQTAKLNRYHESFRFGTASEAGIKIQVVPHVTLEAGYERSIVFERHLFWKWAGSAVIEAVGHFALDSFINEILDSSPYAGPVVFLVLKSAFSYGIYELRQEKMNWPFNTAAPIANDQFKFGMTFNF